MKYSHMTWDDQGHDCFPACRCSHQHHIIHTNSPSPCFLTSQMERGCKILQKWLELSCFQQSKSHLLLWTSEYMMQHVYNNNIGCSRLSFQCSYRTTVQVLDVLEISDNFDIWEIGLSSSKSDHVYILNQWPLAYMWKQDLRVRP